MTKERMERLLRSGVLTTDEKWSAIEYLRPKLVNFAMRHGFSRDESEDIVQDSGIKLLRTGSISTGTWTTYIYRAVSNGCYDRRRRAGRKGHSILATELEGNGDAPGSAILEAVATVEEPIKTLMMDERPLGLLCEQSRETIKVYLMFQGNYKDCTKALGIAEGTFKSRLNRAKRNYLRACVQLNIDLSDHALVA